ncbi:MAG: ATP-binding protein [bacterium]|nr:ATP-binding protein [bacterium]
MKELLILLQSRTKMVFFVLLSIILILLAAWMNKLSISYVPVIGIIFLTCLINGVFLVFIKQEWCLRMVKQVQPVINILLITIGIHYTGGIESIFVYLYLMVITGESIRMGIKRGYFFATVSLLCYGLVIALEFMGTIPHIHTSDFFNKDAYKNVSFFLVTYATIIVFLVAFLSGYLSQVVRHILQAKNEELILANQKIISTTNLLQAILDNMSEGVISVAADQTILSANTKSYYLLNIQEKDIINKPLKSIFSETLLSSSIEQALKKEKNVSCQIDIPLDENQSRSILAKITPLKDKDGYFSGVVIVFQDISTEKRFFAIKATLLSIFSHELRTPLTSIKAYTEILMDEVVKERNKEFLQVISDETDRLDMLIESFICFSKMELKNFNLKKESINISRLMDGLINAEELRRDKAGVFFDRIKKLAKQKNILLYCETTAEEITVFGDYSQIKKAIECILDNAIKFTPEDGRVTVSVKPGVECVDIRVSDTGIGIDPANHMRIFEPFYQVDPSTTRNTGGVGMGLTVAKGIIEAHGGEISVESRLEKGSTFIVTIPVEK